MQDRIYLAKAAKKTDKKDGKKADKKSKSKKNQEPAAEEEITGEITAINVDRNKGEVSGYFSGINKSVLELVQKGSPESLVAAYESVKKASVDYKENERVLVFIIVETLRIVWPSQTQGQNFDLPAVPERNIYTGAIESAKNGIYDTSTGNGDFLANALPSLVLKSPVTNRDYYPEAESHLKAALSFAPKSVLANYLLALLYSKSNRNAEAVELLKPVAQESKAFEIHYLYATCLNALGRYEESKSVTDNLIVLYPSSIDLLKLLSRNAYASGDYNTAERYALMALQQNPADLEMVLFRAKIFVATGEYLKATSLLDVYAKSNNTAKDYLLLRARVQKEWNKNTTLAVSTIEKALSLYPNDLDALLAAAELAGESGMIIGKRSGAELAGQVLAVEPDNQQALTFLIQTLAQEGKWSEAYASSKKIMAGSNPSIDAICAHTRICLALGYYAEAWEKASALYNKSPNNEKAIQLYVESMVRTGKSAQASRYINTAINGASSSMKSFLLYQRSFLASDEAAQLSDLRSAVIANPRNSDALFRMYKIYFTKQDYRKAQYYLRQVIALNPNKQQYLKLNAELDKLIR
ncbi:MAG: tetratricopeptide repeat protein [Treponema sp.]|nr:tetratricopeptide repeat protein [Treponema sp.]